MFVITILVLGILSVLQFGYSKLQNLTPAFSQTHTYEVLWLKKKSNYPLLQQGLPSSTYHIREKYCINRSEHAGRMQETPAERSTDCTE